MRRGYDLSDLGYLYRGPASVKTREIKFGDWTIVDVPIDVADSSVIDTVSRTIDNICAIELPTSFICNLRCKYCYIEDPRMKSKKNDPQIFINLLRRAFELFPKFKQNSREVYVTPWGAEPLCDLDTLEAVYEYCLDNLGENFRTSTSTNATIWNPRVEKILEKLIKRKCLQDLQISLDGPKHVQDKYRPYLGGKGSFDDVKSFTLHFYDLCSKLKVETKLHHFCSTIHLNDDNFVEAWVAAAEFFTEPNTWHFQPNMPMRVSALDFDNEENYQKFIDAQKGTHEVIKKRVSQGIFCADFYTSKLFLEKSCRSKNAFSYCSALNTQIGLDVDGSIYMCHGPITSPWQKPYMWLGNILEGVISYQKLVRNLSWMYNTYSRAKCTTCPFYFYALGNVCWSCPTHNLAATGEPTTDFIQKCGVYCECFKYWYANACMVCKGEVIERVPKNEWFTEGIDYDSLPSLPEEQKVDPIKRSSGHFDWDYDGLLMHALRRVMGFDDYKSNRNFHINGRWWKFFNFFDVATKEKSREVE